MTARWPFRAALLVVGLLAAGFVSVNGTQFFTSSLFVSPNVDACFDGATCGYRIRYNSSTPRLEFHQTSATNPSYFDSGIQMAGGIQVDSGAITAIPLQLTAVISGNGIGGATNGQVTRAEFKITIGKDAWIAAAVTQDISIGVLPAKAKIVAVYADTTTAYAGLAGTIQVQLGTTAGGAQLILAHDVKTGVVTKGLADADLGASITRAAAIQGGFIPSWTATTTVSARLTSGTGNIGTGAATNLSNGSTTYYLVVDFT